MACLLVFGCGGKGKTDTSENKKQTKEVVRKIPGAAPQQETAADKKPQDKPRSEAPAAVPASSGKAEIPEGVKQQPQSEPAPVDGGQASTPEPLLSEEKKAEMEAVTREAGDIKQQEPAIPGEKPKTAPSDLVVAESRDPVQSAPEGLAETDQPAPPVIDLGVKEGAEGGSEDSNLLGYDQEGTGTGGEEEGSDTFNPFAPLFQKEKTGVAMTTSPDRQQRKFITELEKIDIGQLTLEGIIQAQTGNRAIVTDASGKGYVVKEGTYIGLNSGTVEKIESDRIVIAENIGTRQSKTVLKLQKPAGD
ncbi:MAG: pilus assembly protein PilP [Thermodesulfobacteriota bacterium]